MLNDVTPLFSGLLVAPDEPDGELLDLELDAEVERACGGGFVAAREAPGPGTEVVVEHERHERYADRL